MSRSPLNRKISIAPMLDWTDRHYRFLARIISKHSLLYTEMVTTGALLHGDQARHLDFSEEEQPVALQLGGSNPDELAECAKLAEHWGSGYDEINLNCGCPSDRVQSGRFGASLMAEPDLVADCLKEVSDAVSIPVTLKCRIGIDRQDDYEPFRDFIHTVTDNTGCNTVIVHARKAWLDGLSPKENREIPPLRYDYVYRLKKELPDLEIIINGGIKTLDECQEHLTHVDGVMMGREAYQNPFILNEVDQLFFSTPANSNTAKKTRLEICEEYITYCKNQMEQGIPLHHLSRHLLGLYREVKGAKQFRRYISENVHKENADIEVLEKACLLISG